MSRKNSFVQAWKTRFPKDDPPDLELFDSDTRPHSQTQSPIDSSTAIQRALCEHEEKVKVLQKQLYQSEFIVSFLWDLLHKERSRPTSLVVDGVHVGIGSENSEDRVVQEVIVPSEEVPSRDATDGETEPASEEADSGGDGGASVKRKDSVRDLVNNFEKQESVPLKSPGLPLQEEEGDPFDFAGAESPNVVFSSIKRKKFALTKTYSEPSVKPKPIPAPRPSKRGPVFVTQRHSVCPLTESVSVTASDHQTVSQVQAGTEPQQEGSASNTQGSSAADIKPDGELSTTMSESPKQTIGLGQQSNGEVPKPCKPPRLRPLRASKNKVDSDTDGSPKLQVETTDDSMDETIKSNRKLPPYDNVEIPPAVSPTEVSDDEVIYDEPIPVSRSDIESDSSSEDEDPIYYNILLMKHHSINHVSLNAEAIYASVDIQKKNLEKRAKRLSRKFSSSGDESPTKSSGGSSFMPSVPEDHSHGGSFVQLEDSTVGESSDSVFPPTPSKTPQAMEDFAVWKKRQSLIMALKGEDSTSDTDELDVMVPSCAETEKWQMRKWVVTSILDSERGYVDVLDVVLQYMKTFRAVVDKANSVISNEDIDTIFGGIPQLHEMHAEFIRELEPRVEAWSPEQNIADVFKILALKEYPVATDYLKNYQKAVQRIGKCSQENPNFHELIKEIPCRGMTEKPSLEELLHKPVVRFQRNTLVLHDLIKCTPASHADYDLLQKTLKIAHNFLDNFTSPIDKDCSENQRYLAKQSLVVERVTSQSVRKLRHMFLFNDVIVCCKQKMGAKQRIHYDVKWYIPLVDLLLIDKKSAQAEEQEMANSHRKQIETLQHRVSDLQSELKTELKRARGAQELQRNWSLRGHNKNIEKLKKRLAEQEAQLLLASPHLILKLHSKKQEKPRVMLLSSDYERSSWSDTIVGLQNRASQYTNSMALSTVELQNQINLLKLPKMSALGSMLDREDLMLGEDYLFGSLNVTIHRLQGLKQKADTHCCLEVDSFGHFFIKAKTNTIMQVAEPCWNEDFEIDLEGAQTLRILCYSEDNTLLGKCALELSKAWLRGDFSENSVSLNEDMSIVVSMRYATRDQTLKRTPSAVKGGLFGVRINHIAKRENTQIPIIVTTCIEEIERRGMEDLGIYRVSGLSSEIQKLRKAFEKSSVGARTWAGEADVNVVTGTLKLYLRELPEALFTDHLYPPLVEGIGLSDPEAKEKCMLSLFKALPQTNRCTAVFIIDHLVRVSKQEGKNKMTLHNLATVFGPTLLRPAFKEPQPMSMELFSAGARDAMLQTGILLFFLNLRAAGTKLV